MPEHSHKPESPLEEVNINIDNAGKNPVGWSGIHIPASILLGSLLVCGTIFYSTRTVLKKLDTLSGSGAIAQQQGQGAPAAGANQQAQPGAPVKITLQPDTPYLGKPDAKVTVVEYADYQCPFCEKWYTGVFPQLKSKYIDTGKIKFVFQDFAFLGADSNTASEAVHCAADQNKFWEYHDYLFSHQGQENTGWATAVHQKEFAKTVGLNVTKFNQCLDSHKYQKQVQDETNAGKSYGVTGTPTTFVNGQIIVGAQPIEAFEQAIDAALK